LDLFPFSGEGREIATLLGLSERETEFSFSKEFNRVDISLPSLEDGYTSSFRNVVFSSYLEIWTKDKVQKPSEPPETRRLRKNLPIDLPTRFNM
jgi:hypothetical protein